MNWYLKALIAGGLASIPFGDRVYKSLQVKYGRLQARPLKRLDDCKFILALLKKRRCTLENMKLVEIGTGHIPTIPLLMALAGATKIHTLDVEHKIEFNLVEESVRIILANRGIVINQLAPFTDAVKLDKGFNIFNTYKSEPKKLLDQMGIKYIAPANMSSFKFRKNSIDIIFSVNVLEHVPHNSLVSILKESKRVLKCNGISIHSIDMSDHFAHTDSRITKINFLKYSDFAWKIIAGNRFSYTNRLRINDYIKIFQLVGYKVDIAHQTMDDKSLNALGTSINPSRSFNGYSRKQLCVSRLVAVLETQDSKGTLI